LLRQHLCLVPFLIGELEDVTFERAYSLSALLMEREPSLWALLFPFGPCLIILQEVSDLVPLAVEKSLNVLILEYLCIACISDDVVIWLGLLV